MKLPENYPQIPLDDVLANMTDLGRMDFERAQANVALSIVKADHQNSLTVINNLEEEIEELREDGAHGDY